MADDEGDSWLKGDAEPAPTIKGVVLNKSKLALFTGLALATIERAR